MGRLNLRIVYIISLATCAFACGPEPGTPEYVLAKVRDGHVVGGANLEILTGDHLDAMLSIINDPDSVRMARLQLTERAIRMEEAGAFDRLSPLINHKDPEIRIIVIRWFSHLGNAKATNLLIDRLRIEKEKVVKINIITTLIRIGVKTRDPDAAVLAKLIGEFESKDNPMPKDWVRVLGGWRGEPIIRALQKAMSSSDEEMCRIAAQALAGPAVRELKIMGPILMNMLDHKQLAVRKAGLMGLTSATYPGRILAVKDCAETPTLALLSTLPELPKVIKTHISREGIEKEEKTLAEALDKCLSRHTTNPDASSPESKEAS
ncbi:MAG: hypothetical protein GY854_27890 [Deltaproteobacteria bacterium]|nr:hypothetical protein [Deltaproteobacteria bacterium]